MYKLKKGKQEQYLKDDRELEDYETSIALKDASLHVNADAPGIGGEALESLVNRYREVYAIIDRLSRLYPKEVLEALVQTLRCRRKIFGPGKKSNPGPEK